MKKNAIFLTVLFILFSYLSYAQLVVTDGLDGQQLGEILAGDNITVTNASITGNDQQYGSFTFTGDGLEVNSGVILSSGDIFDAEGPNSSGTTSTNFGGAGNDLLTELSGQQTYDATVLEFDFEVQSDEIEFNFIFMSEEYNEYVGTAFNDAFAFYISGPGIDGEENIAVVPGTTTPVTINTINNDDFWQFYHDNTDGNTDIEFDGFTTLMTATKSGLQACETYTLKLMIADASDGIYDSGVLLQENSLVQASISASSSTYSNNNIALEGCIEADFIFQLDEPVDFDVEIPLEIGGTAINGVDYKYIDPMIVIPAGQTMATMIIESYSDGMTEGQEIIEISFVPSPCQPPETVSLFIDDFEPIEFSATETGTNCNGAEDGEVLFTITGGFAPYLINLTDTITHETTQYSENPVLGLPAGTYAVEIIDSYGCKAEDIVFGDIFNAGVTFLPTGTGVTYQTSIEITGFDDGQTIETIDQLQLVALSIEHSYANDISITLRSPDGTEVLLKDEGPGSPGGNTQNCVDLGEPVSSGSCYDNWNADNITPGIGYEYIWNHDPVHGTMTYEREQGLLPSHTYVTTFGNELIDAVYFEPGSYEPYEPLDAFVGSPLNGEWTIEVTDFYILDNGYIFEWSMSLSSPQSDSIITISEPIPPVVTSNITEPDCGMSNGAIDITVSDLIPTSYLWSNTETTEDITNLASGTYSVNIAGDDGCDYDYDFNLSSNGSLVLGATSEPETCPNADNGSIDLTVTGGTEPFTFSWDTGQTDEDITNLAPGDYTVTVTDNTGCIGIETFTVLPATPIFVASNITDENCGDAEGAINITVSGGTEGYTFLWTSGETTEDIDELSQGTYTVTVTDANACTYEEAFTITNYVGNCVPDCDLAITNSNITDEMCGNTEGEIDLTIFTTYSPYTVEWTNGQTTDDINSLVAGDYSITIIDAEGCELTEAYTINNQTSGLEIVSINATNETCGNGAGEIDITVNGGAMPYTFAWDNGEPTEDLTGLNEDSYNVVVTDANGCSTSASADITNEAGDLAQTWGNSVNEICGNAQGSIDILIEGGNSFWYGYNYLWSNGETTEDLIGLSAGNYSCVITDQDGCQITTPTYTVDNEAGDLAINDIDLDNEICGNANGEIEILVGGGNEPYVFSWSNGETTQDIFDLTAGTYIGTVTDNNGCSVNTGDLTLINESGTLALNNINTTDELCDNNAGSIDITITGGSTPYIYLWNTGSSSEDLSGINAGNYSCLITDQNGCEVNVNTTINNENGAIAISNTVATDETCGNSNGAVDITITGAALPISYSWDSGQTSEDLTGISAGTYNCVVTDNLGCQTNANATIVNNAGTLSLDNANITNEQCGNADGFINLFVSGTETPFVFNWDNGETTEDISNLVAGDYSCVITDNVGCSVNAGPYTINNSSSTISVSNIASTDETCGSGNGDIDLTISGGAMPIIYAWSNGATTQDITGLSAGTYDYTITDNSGCSISGSVEIFNNAGDLNIDSHFITNEICSNGNGGIDITVSGADPITYAWNNGATTQDITGLSTGIYSVVVTDNNGCVTNSNDYNVLNEPGAFALVDLDATDEICNNDMGSIEVDVENGTNPIVYAWSNGSTQQDITNLSEGSYSCVATDANGCELSYSATIFNYDGDLAVDNAVITDENCSNQAGAIDITYSGANEPATFAWSNGETTEDISSLATGNYSVVITDNAGCSITSETYFIDNIGGAIVIDNATITDETCGNQTGAINITYSGANEPTTFVWNNGETTEDINSLATGNYSVVITDNLGCSVTSETYFVDNNGGTIVIDNATITDETCGNQTGAINITYSGANEPTTFAWSNGETTEDISSLATGNYSVVITDNLGCSITSSNYFVDNTGGTLVIDNANITDETCGNQAGAIDITYSGGNEPSTFAWSNGVTTEDINSLATGNYSVVITDNFGCSITSSNYFVDNTPNAIIIDNAAITEEACGNQAGAIDITYSGANEPATFTWNNGATTEDVNSLATGNYSVVITDNLGCSITSETYFVDNNGSAIIIDNAAITNETCGNQTGAINITYSGADEPTTFAWSNGETTEDISSLATGNYSVVITDNLGCSITSETYFVDNNGSAIIIDNAAITNETCGNQTGAIDISYSGADEPTTFAWSNGETTEDISSLATGNYSVVITDNLGCSITSETYFIDNNGSAIVIDNATITNETCGNQSGAIDISYSGASEPTTFAWSNGETTEDISSLATGNYSVVITDNLGCSITSETYFIDNNGSAIVIDNATITNETCGNQSGAIDISYSGASEPTTFAWSNGETTEDISSLATGNYSVVITDNSGCSFTSETYFVDNTANTLVIDNANIIDENCGNQAGVIDITYSGGNEPATFAWSNGETTEDISSIAAGSYSVVITDNLGCSITSDTYVVENITNGFEIQSSTVTDENCDNSNGAIDLTIIGGEMPYTFDWTNGSTNEDLVDLSAGTYSCIITDNVGCVLNFSVEIINIPSQTVINLETITNDECDGGTGGIDITVSNGEEPYTFLWSNGETTEDLENVTAGDYTITITDNLGCSITSDIYTVENTENTDIEIVNIEIQNDFCSWGEGSINYEPAVPGDYIYELDGVPGTLPFELLVVGDYVISIIDGACRVDETVTVESESFFNIVLDNAENETCGQGNGLIEISLGGPGSSGNFSYNWSNGETNQDIYDLAAADYTCEVVHVNSGCTESILHTITNSASFTYTSTKTDATCDNEDGAIDVTIEPAGTYTFTWNNGADTEDLNNISAGIYTCQITDTEGCSDILTQEIFSVSNELTIIADIQDDVCGQSVGSIQLDISDDPMGHTTLWNTGETTDFLLNITSGTYTATITDIEFGCIDIRTYKLKDAPLFTVSEAITHSTCETCPDGEIDITANPYGTYTYTWSTGATTEDITDLLPGDYTVEVYDENNCSVSKTFTVDIFENVLETSECSINVYPNPVTDILFIEFDLLDKKNATISVYNILGELITTKDITQNKGTISINTQSYAVGIYTIEIKTDNYSKVVKFIKN